MNLLESVDVNSSSNRTHAAAAENGPQERPALTNYVQSHERLAAIEDSERESVQPPPRVQPDAQSQRPWEFRDFLLPRVSDLPTMENQQDRER